MPSKKKSDIKQKQKQSQNVKVIVNLADKKVKRKKRAKRKPTQKPAVVDFKAFPPQIIYPSAPLTFYNRDVFPESASILEKPPVPKSLASGLEDVGNVGTSEILSAPSKKEALEELQTPVPMEEQKMPLSLGSLVNITKIPQSFTDMNVLEEQIQSVETPKGNIPKKKKKKVLILEEDEAATFGIPPQPIVTEQPIGTNKKKGRPKKQDVNENKQKLITDFYNILQKKKIPNENISRIKESYDFKLRTNTSLRNMIKNIKKQKFNTPEEINDYLEQIFV